MVVAYHSSCPYGNWCWDGYHGNIVETGQVVNYVFLRVLCNTMLPVFFMISGMLFYSKENKYLNDKSATLWKKFDRLMIPYFIIFTICWWLALPKIGVASSSGHLWFVRDLFIIFIISILLAKMPKWVLMSMGGAFYILFILSSKFSILLPEMVENIAHYYIFFISGYYINNHLVKLRNSRLVKGIVIIGWLATLLIGIRSVNPLLCCIMLVCCIPNVEVKNEWVRTVDKDSFAIYMIHHVLIFALFQIPFIQHLYASSACVAIPTMFVLLIILSLFIAELLHRIGFRYF